jgi:hypothetical protein
MKKIWILLIFAMAASWSVMGNSFASEEKESVAPAEEIIIKGEKKSAKFSHPVHLELGVSCGQCHHDSEHKPLTDTDITAMADKTQLQCISCHNQDFANAELQSMKDVFHARCRDCHKQGFNGKTGPSKCNDCHVKE